MNVKAQTLIPADFIHQESSAQSAMYTRVPSEAGRGSGCPSPRVRSISMACQGPFPPLFQSGPNHCLRLLRCRLPLHCESHIMRSDDFVIHVPASSPSIIAFRYRGDSLNIWKSVCIYGILRFMGHPRQRLWASGKDSRPCRTRCASPPNTPWGGCPHPAVSRWQYA
jgi:hypothetical protein